MGGAEPEPEVKCCDPHTANSSICSAGFHVKTFWIRTAVQKSPELFMKLQEFWMEPDQPLSSSFLLINISMEPGTEKVHPGLVLQQNLQNHEDKDQQHATGSGV